jgi:hypothetical protein
MMWGYDQVEGWFFSKKWNYYQNRKGNVSSYVENYIGFYRIHVTYSGALGMCDIELRRDTPKEAFAIAEEYLEKYKDTKEKRELWQDYYSPHNPEGYWEKEYKRDER